MAKKVGRPPDYTKETFKTVVASYFLDPGGIPNKAGLLYTLDISRETWRRYKEKPEFSDTIRMAEAQIENAWIQQLAGPGATGPIFYLKNAFKEEYKDRHETDVTSGGEKIQGVIVLPAKNENQLGTPAQADNSSSAN